MTVGSFISAQDYTGYGSSSLNEVEELRKALTAGDDVNDPGVGAGVGFPLRVESLEATMKNTTFEMDEIKLFKTIPKIPATNTVEEFNRLISYGRGGATRFNLGFMDEGALPEEEDSTYERVTVKMKYIGVTGRVTDQMMAIRNSAGSAISIETMNKTMVLLKNLENALFFGDSTLIPQQFDGLAKSITDGAPDNVIDLRGAPLSENALNDMLLRIRDNFGTATDAYFATGASSDLAKQVYDRQRFNVAPQPGVLGATITAFQGQHGRINLHDHVFFNDGLLVETAGLGSPTRRPNAPSILVQPAAAANAASKFVVADAGTYFYQVVAGNQFGLSTPVASSSVAVAAGDQVTFTIQDNGQNPTYYEIYRTAPGAAVADANFMVRIPRTAVTQVVIDLNDDIPGTSQGFVLMQNMRSFSWAQLLPMTRKPLAAIDTSTRWAQILFGGLKMYTPEKNVLVKNIGRAPGSL